MTGDVDIRVGQVYGECGVVVLDRGTQQHRALPVQQQLEPREIAGIAMEQPFRRAAMRDDIPIVVEQSEGVAVLERAQLALLQRYRGRNIELRFRFCARFSNRRGSLPVIPPSAYATDSTRSTACSSFATRAG